MYCITITEAEPKYHNIIKLDQISARHDMPLNFLYLPYELQRMM